MDVNDPLAPSGSRQVAGYVLLAGVEVPFVSWDVDSNSFYSADTFSIVFALSAMPADTGALWWWSNQTDIEISISSAITGKNSCSMKSLITGGVDKWHFNPAKFEVTAEGRDYTAKFIDTKTSEKFSNYTTSQVATMLAQRHGLTPIVTPTTTSVGAITKYDHTHVTDERTEWDLLSYFAGLDGFQVYVTGNELHYEPALDPDTADQYVIRWHAAMLKAYPQSNVSDDLQFERDLTLAKGVTVQVRSWNAKSGKAYTESYPTNSARGIAPGQAVAKRQVYSVVRSGLDRQGAQALAQAIHKQITQHEMRMSASMPGDNLLTASTIIRVEGSDSTFDQLYYPDSVRRSMSFESGYSMSLTAKNHNPNSMVLP
ncbi:MULTISPECIES: rhs element Vgr protein [unclassified Pseudomonas]|uniref:rhs element Vgr protein n=1 Tax=unclassified Pseudomonas TaxID=196821 RepID=UPI002B2336C6|nr:MULTISPECIES: rhs element Vgr protein [unclassified Pseudomonas]MEA9994528.1 rhs element Vgr protein [Pseudomonas sp. AA4]MEB0085672.1 rhs element Vgr protein [Pseudomonas sp. RTI1]MEB0126002.1 rhs element Vgr protein [Pseudomonas sp. CCC1.2]MEB0152807.1 rhs element Vgr protein [Pseudomonas sp. CCC4.3]MEB0221312.1 rhs element Vgr protein [Pseudomonas sp. AB12(2023)]